MKLNFPLSADRVLPAVKRMGKIAQSKEVPFKEKTNKNPGKIHSGKLKK